MLKFLLHLQNSSSPILKASLHTSILLFEKGVNSWYKGVDKLISFCNEGNQQAWEITELATKGGNLLRNKYEDNWGKKRTTFQNNSKLDLYITLKDSFGAEGYLDNPEFTIRKAITKLRISSHKFPIEIGRYINIPKLERKCPLCKNGVGSEEHYLLKCCNPRVSKERDPILDILIASYPGFVNLETNEKCKYILACENPEHVSINGLLCHRIQKAFEEEMLLLQQSNQV